jgi:hypothetical protein
MAVKPVLLFALNSYEMYHLMRPVAGEGGWQDFIRALQAQVFDAGEGSMLVELFDADLGRAMRGMVGDGGFQGRLRKVLRRQIINFLEEL